jgi:hypothetical protein
MIAEEFTTLYLPKIFQIIFFKFFKAKIQIRNPIGGGGGVGPWVQYWRIALTNGAGFFTLSVHVMKKTELVSETL